MADDEESISHFSHPEHELVKRHYTGTYLCDMCWEDLSGLGYCCRSGCDFAIHDACAGHPQTLFCPEHHPHELMLVQTPRRDDDASGHICDVCAGSCAAGCFLYRCTPCGFDMHPRCVRLPKVVRSGRHHPEQHDLKLITVADEGLCAGCHRGGPSAPTWYYRCTVCSDMDFHVSCAAAPAGDGVPRDTNGELVLASLKAQRDMNYAIAIAKIQATGAASIRDLAGGYSYRTRYI
ncbi:unnamed protein product [Urochloa humidicola]